MNIFDEIKPFWIPKRRSHTPFKKYLTRPPGILSGLFYDVMTQIFTEYFRVEYDRRAKYRDYDEMETLPEIGAALRLYADNAVMEGIDGRIIWVETDVAEIKKEWEIFKRRVDLESLLWPIAYNLAKYGDNFYEIIKEEKKGVVALAYIPPATIDIYLKDGNELVYIQNVNPPVEFKPDDIVHFKVLPPDLNSPYGVSMLETARMIWRRFVLLEDAILLHAFIRMVPRLVYKIDVGTVNVYRAWEELNRIKNMLKQRPITDQSGKINLKMALISILDDIWLPIRGERDNSAIEPLSIPETAFDKIYEIFERRLYLALNVPMAYVRKEEIGKDPLAYQDVAFGKAVERLQRAIVKGVEKAFKVHLKEIGMKEEYLHAFKVKMHRPSKSYQDLTLDVERKRAELADALQPFFSKKEILEKVWGIKKAKTEFPESEEEK